MIKRSKLIACSETIYRAFLRLYPQPHRRDYAPLMAQLFRDQCEDAWQEGRSFGIIKFWLRVLPDIGKTSILEHIQNKETMNTLILKNSPAVLLVLGIGLGIASLLFTHSPGALLPLVAASALAILAKALVDVFRPSREWKRMLLASLVLMVVYGFFMPAWARFGPPASELFKEFVMISLFANPVVALAKSLQFFIQRGKVS